MNKKAKRGLAVITALLLALTAAVPAMGLAAEEPSEELLGGCVFTVDNDGLPMSASMSLAQNGLDPAHGRWAAVSDGAEFLSPGELLATGQTLQARNIEGGTLQTLDVVVKGDVTGTGVAGINQVVRLASAMSGADPLTGVWLEAADLNGSGGLDISDLVIACDQLQNLNTAAGISLERTTVPLRAPEGLQEELGIEEIDVAFLDQEMDIPYVPAQQAEVILERVIAAAFQGELTSTYSSDGMISVWERENGSSVEINYMTGDILITNMSYWALPSGAESVLDIVAAVGPDSPFQRKEAFERQGAPVMRNLNDYDIQLCHSGDTSLLPLATFSDLCVSVMAVPLAYNGEACFMAFGDSFADLEDEYYSVPTRQRSAALADFTYRELCFAMDLLYGLKEVKNIEAFDPYLETTGQSLELLSTDPVVADRAMFSLLRGYLGDGHSKYLKNSSYAGQDADTAGIISPSVASMTAAVDRMKGLRAAQYPDGVPAYQEVGNTAYITFDSFVFAGETYTAETLPEADDPSLSTAGLIRYANEQIKRPDSPIEKVVVDLSCNGGGEVDAAVFVVSWFLGEAPLSLIYTTSGAEATTVYQADVDGNGVFDEASDTVKDLDLYCLISDVSFSCGNLVPALFKNSEQVTLLGKQSHGGACAVGYLTAADGTLLRISSPLQLSWLYNGSFYHIDQGVDPDIPITIDAHYYDRVLVSDYLGTLLR